MERMQAMLDHSVDIFSLLDGEGRLLYNSPAAQRLHGFDAAEMDGKNTFDFIHPEDAPKVGEAFQHCMIHPGEPVRVEYRYARKDGTWIWMEAVAINLLEKPEVQAIVVNSRDVSKRVEAQEALRESERFSESAINALSSNLVILDVEGRILKVNQAWREFAAQNGLGGIQPWEGLDYLNICDAVTGGDAKDAEAMAEGIRAMLRGDLPEFSLQYACHSPQEQRWFQARVTRFPGVPPTPLVISHVNITSLKNSERNALESEARYRALFNNMMQGFALCRLHVKDGVADDFTYLEVNAAFSSLTGLKDVVGKRVTELIPGIREADPGLFERYARVVQTGVPERFEIFVAALNMWFSISVYRPMEGHFVAVFDVITERKLAEEERLQLERQLHRSQKMESLGSLAGGVAHDMNNVLGSILGLASLHEEALAPGSPAQQAFATIAKACHRGGGLVRRLLDFARQELSEVKELNLNSLLQEEAQLLERTLLARLHFSLDLAKDLRPIRGDAAALTHAVMNLCVNAVDAMPEGGSLTLRTRNGAPGWVELEVEDSGSGMPKDVLDKALDPFFTTKPQGKGTGLGLAIVYGTVKAHRGAMEIFSEPHRGTKVVLRFPACEPSEPESGNGHAEGRAPGGRALDILLVDDDELIRSSLEAVLQALGHRVVITESGEAALKWLASGRRPQVIILDMNMPGLGGAGTLPRIRALQPEVPVLLSTGRADQSAQELTQAFSGVTLLPKPFSMAELQKRLAALGHSGDPTPTRD